MSFLLKWFSTYFIFAHPFTHSYLKLSGPLYIDFIRDARAWVVQAKREEAAEAEEADKKVCNSTAKCVHNISLLHKTYAFLSKTSNQTPTFRQQSLKSHGYFDFIEESRVLRETSINK